MTALTVIILTRDEARHIRRAIASVKDIATRIVVVDSGSTDDTVALAQAAGAEVLHNRWVNHATQFNWAVDQIGNDGGWIMRLDADEVVTPDLAAEIVCGLPDVAGIFVRRRIHFLGQPVRYGGVFPIRVLRLFRHGAGRCEDRWMDEHILVDGATAALRGEIIDDNQNSLDWWIAKHNAYASREVIDVLNRTHRFLPGALPAAGQVGVKRWVKDNIYAQLPGGMRAGAYFLYRYVLRFGFLDGRQARSFHVLQGFWYRYLVDAKLQEVQRHMRTHNTSAVEAIHQVLGIDLRPDAEPARRAA